MPVAVAAEFRRSDEQASSCGNTWQSAGRSDVHEITLTDHKRLRRCTQTHAMCTSTYTSADRIACLDPQKSRRETPVTGQTKAAREAVLAF
jgi:hypothetical protein